MSEEARRAALEYFKNLIEQKDKATLEYQYYITAIEALSDPCDNCIYSTKGGCQYEDIAETIPTGTPPCKDMLKEKAFAEWLSERGYLNKIEADYDFEDNPIDRIEMITAAEALEEYRDYKYSANEDT